MTTNADKKEGSDALGCLLVCGVAFLWIGVGCIWGAAIGVLSAGIAILSILALLLIAHGMRR